jgi:hypothetical protein
MRSWYYPRSATRGRVRMKNEDYMDEINVRILRVTDDLRAIQHEMNCAAMQAPSNPELMESLSGISETESLRVLQSAIDQMRHFLWFYGQILTGEPAVTDHLRERKPQPRPASPQERAASDKTAWPSETTLIRMLADGRNRKPN